MPSESWLPVWTSRAPAHLSGCQSSPSSVELGSQAAPGILGSQSLGHPGKQGRSRGGVPRASISGSCMTGTCLLLIWSSNLRKVRARSFRHAAESPCPGHFPVLCRQQCGCLPKPVYFPSNQSADLPELTVPCHPCQSPLSMALPFTTLEGHYGGWRQST